MLSAVLAIAVAGCDRPKPAPPATTDVERIENARSALANLIKGLEASPYADAPHNANYLIPAYRRGIDLLSSPGLTGSSKPVPLVALFRLPGDDGHQGGMTIAWLEPGFEVKGFSISCNDQDPLEFGTWPQWHERDREWFSSTVWRDSAVGVVVHDRGDAEQERRPASVSFDEGSPVIHLPGRLARGPMRLSLVLNSGEHTAEIDVFTVDGSAPATRPSATAAEAVPDTPDENRSDVK